MDTSIRVLVANRPRLLRELVMSTLSEQAGISVVGETDNERDVPSMVAKTKPDFLVIALDEPQRRPPLCDCCCGNFRRCELLPWLRTPMLEFITGPRSKSIQTRWKRARKRSSKCCGEACCR
jgi:DNA-binding NarL/FixJ family response regulator